MPMYKIAERYLRIISSSRDVLASDAVKRLREMNVGWAVFQHGMLKQIRSCHKRTVIRKGVVINGSDTYQEVMDEFKRNTEIYTDDVGSIYWMGHRIGSTNDERALAGRHVCSIFEYERFDFTKKEPRLKDYHLVERLFCPLRNCSMCGVVGGGDNVAFRGIYGNNLGMRYSKQADELRISYRGVKDSILCRKCLGIEAIRVRRATDVIKNRILINKIFTQSKRLKEAKNG